MQQSIPRDDARDHNPNAYRTRSRKKNHFDSKSSCPMPLLRTSKEPSNGNKWHVHTSRLFRKTSSCTDSILTSTDCSNSTLTSPGSSFAMMSVESDTYEKKGAHANNRSSRKEPVSADISIFYDGDVDSDESSSEMRFPDERQSASRFDGIPSVDTRFTNNTMPEVCITPKLLFQNNALVSDRKHASRGLDSPALPNNKLWTQLRAMFSAYSNGEQVERTSNGGIFCLCTDVEKSPECSPSDPYGTKNYSNPYDTNLFSTGTSFTPMLHSKELNASPAIKKCTNVSVPDCPPSLMKTVKRNNIKCNLYESSSLSDSSEIIILDETDPDLQINDGLGKEVSAYRSTADFTSETNCYYRGFDGNRNHYTYVLDTERAIPKKIRENMTADKMLGSTVSPAKGSSKAALKPPQDLEQTIKDAKTVLHVISPVREKKENAIECDSQNASSASIRSKQAESFVTCNSMNTEEHDIVVGFTQPNIDIDGLVCCPPEILNRENCGDKTNLSPLGNQTIGTFATNGTLHRRRNSTSVFTAASLAQIFQPAGGICSTPPKATGESRADLTKTIKKVKYDNAVLDEISPLGGYQGRVGSIGSAHDGESFHSPLMERIIGPSRKELFTPDEKSRRTRDRQVPSSHGRYKELANITSPEHEEPSGYYLPLSNAFKNGSVSSRRHKGCVFEGWLAFSKGGRLYNTMSNSECDSSPINWTDLRYVIIENDNLYVYRSKRNKPKKNDSLKKEKDDSVKILKLTKNMSVETQSISRKHGQCVFLKDRSTNVTFCTLLPVLLDPSFFRDQEYSQVVCQKKFNRISKNLFREKIEERSKLKELSLNGETSSPARNDWPQYIDHVVSDEQNTAVMHVSFALDAAIRLSMFSGE